MFISLKWKAVVFLSVVLVLITLAWVGQSVLQTINDFKIERRQLQQNHQQILDQLLADNFLKLSQFAQLVADKTMSRQALAVQEGKQDTLSEVLQGQWLGLNVDLGLDYLSLYDDKLRELGHAYSTELFRDVGQLQTLLTDRAGAASQSGPQSFVYCQIGCMQFIVEPIVLSHNNEGYIVLGQNMADTVLSYNEFSYSDVAVLLHRSDITNDIDTNSDRDRYRDSEERYLSGWQMDTWAISRSDIILPQLQHYSARYPLALEDDSVFFDTPGERYRFVELDMDNHHFYGRSAAFVDITDEGAARQRLIAGITNGVVTGVLGLIFSEAILILLMLGPMRRLVSIAEALKLLPRHLYDKAATTVQRTPSYINDELTTLEDSTVYVANALSQLHSDVQQKNDELNEQIMLLSRSRAFLTRLFDSSHLYILTQNDQGRILTSNKLFDTVLSPATGSYHKLFSEQGEQAHFCELIKKLYQQQDELVHQELEFIDLAGCARYISWTHTLVEDEQGVQQVLSVGTDLTHRKEAENSLQWLVNHDSLTGIGNRRAFKEHLHYLLTTRTEGALVFIDVNRFKQINDIYGHHVGDKVLMDIAKTLKHHTRATDYISRLAGDEFTIILTRVNRQTVVPLLDKLARQLMGRYSVDDKNIIEYSASLGVSFFPEHGNTEQSLIVHADRAMYQAKKKGLGRWHIYDAQDDNLPSLKKENRLITLIKHALEKDLFDLAFQPILDLESGVISHYEVLLRMEDDTGQPISPGEFIPLAERVGLIRAIDLWVLEHALLLLEKKLKSQPELTFAVNVSAPSLQDSSFPQLVLDYLHKYSISPGSLVIELTETAYIDNFEQVLDNLNQLASAGIAIALDDFGVGFSSFSYLKRMPLTYVKLDGSYIQQLGQNPDNQVFVDGLSRLVNAFGMKTIAEFVEDQETLELLHLLGVSYAQGYYIGKPAPELLPCRQLGRLTVDEPG